MKRRTLKSGRWALLGLSLGMLLPGTSARGAALPPPSVGKLTVLTNLVPALQRQRNEQLASIAQGRAFHNFRFSDGLPKSRLTFQHQPVDDSGRHYKPVHYDHGTAVVAADVDADDRLDLYFTTQLGSNLLWRNVGNGQFEDITATAGVALTDQVSVGASFADVNKDGLPDLFVTTVRHGNHLFLNLGSGRFRDVTEAAGLGYSGHSSGAVFFDYDNDGRLDLYLCNVGVYTTDRKGRGGYYVGLPDGFAGHTRPERTEYGILYHNLGEGRFEDVTQALGLRNPSWSGDATFADLNGDRWPDLYVLNMQGDDHYYENQGGKAFVDRTAAYFPKTPWGAMGIKFFDFNQDGRMDLFVTDMHSDMTEFATRMSQTNLTASFEAVKADPWCTTQYTDAYLQGASNNLFGNAFYMNLGDGRFEEVSNRIGAETLWPWGVSVGDLNSDGYEDVFVAAGMGLGFRYMPNSVLLNDHGERFRAAEFALGVEPRADGRLQKASFVLDCSGADRANPYCAGRSGPLPILEALSSRSSVVCDLDDDGDLDIVTLEMNDRPQVLISDLSARRAIRFLKVKLVGTVSNRDGLGSRVTVTLEGRRLTQVYDGKSGHLGQSAMPLYFGLGDPGDLKSVEVLWPSGRRQVIDKDLSVNQTLTVTEGSP